MVQAGPHRGKITPVQGISGEEIPIDLGGGGQLRQGAVPVVVLDVGGSKGQGKPQGTESQHQGHQPAQQREPSLTGVGPENLLVNVPNDRTGRNHKQRIRRGHDRRQDHGKKHSRQNQRKQVVHHQREHHFLVQFPVHHSHPVEVLVQHPAAHPGRDRPEIGEDGKQDRHQRSVHEFLVVLHRDKPNEQLGRAQEPPADRHQAQNGKQLKPEPRGRSGNVEQYRIDRPHGLKQFGRPPDRDHRHHRDEGQTKKHQRPLQQVRPGNGQKPPRHAVNDDDGHPEHDPHADVDAQKPLEGLARGEVLPRHVHGHEHRQHQRRHDADDVEAVPKPILEVIGDRDGIVHIGKNLEPLNQEHPGDQDPEDFPESDPVGMHSHEEPKTRQAQEQPAGFSGRPGGETDQPVAELLPGHEKIADALDVVGGDNPDPDQDQEIKEGYGKLNDVLKIILKYHGRIRSEKTQSVASSGAGRISSPRANRSRRRRKNHNSTSNQGSHTDPINIQRYSSRFAIRSVITSTSQSMVPHHVRSGKI